MQEADFPNMKIGFTTGFVHAGSKRYMFVLSLAFESGFLPMRNWMVSCPIPNTHSFRVSCPPSTKKGGIYLGNPGQKKKKTRNKWVFGVGGICDLAFDGRTVFVFWSCSCLVCKEHSVFFSFFRQAAVRGGKVALQPSSFQKAIKNPKDG